ncbi:unnamed protein product [Brassicogethes aeneus]|uniref:Uncharacterized protein n=1 Tax=Brassicogethes aeneus TaxID=1431903 RepID=A0A9P0B3B1_BRAAE|nr:unnamed protein product [Brassicogethes aeneus]
MESYYDYDTSTLSNLEDYYEEQNYTLVNEDPFENWYPNHHYFTVMNVMEFILKVATFFINIFIVGCFFKYSALRTRELMFILNFTILNILYISYEFILTDISSSWYPYYCEISHISFYLFLMNYLMLGLVNVHWYIVNFKENLITKYSRVYQHFFAIIYGISFIIFAGTFSICYSNIAYVIGLQIILWFIAITSVAIHYIGRNKLSLKNSYIPRASIIAMSLWLPMLINHILIQILHTKHFLLNFAIHMAYFTNNLFICSPLVIIYFLTKHNKYFNNALTTFCGIRKKEGEVLENEDDYEEVMIQTPQFNGNV